MRSYGVRRGGTGEGHYVVLRRGGEEDGGQPAGRDEKRLFFLLSFPCLTPTELLVTDGRDTSAAGRRVLFICKVPSTIHPFTYPVQYLAFCERGAYDCCCCGKVGGKRGYQRTLGHFFLSFFPIFCFSAVRLRSRVVGVWFF